MIEIYFLNNGSATLQTSNYVHTYDSMSQLRNDVGLLVRDGEGAALGWDGHCEEERIEFDYDGMKSGHYFAIDVDPSQNYIADLNGVGWLNVEEFINS